MKTDLFSLSLSLVLFLVSLRFLEACIFRWKLRKIPTIGSSSLVSWFGSVKFLLKPHEVLQEGYAKCRGNLFKIAMMDKWMVVATGPRFVEEIRRAPDDTLALEPAIVEQVQLDITLGWSLDWTAYHVDALKGPLTRNIGNKIDEALDEISAAFAEELPHDSEFATVNAMETVMKIVFRVVNRVMLGKPYCRDEEFRKMNIKLVVDAGMHSMFLNLLPKFCQPLVGRCLTNQPKIFAWVTEFLRPLIQDRFDKEVEHGKRNWEGRPNDLVSWLLDHAPPDQRDIFHVVMRILVVEFASVLTTTNAFTNAVLNLAARPECVAPLREELQKVIASEGWSKTSLTKLRKMDSFLKESERTSGSGAFTLLRKALKDFTFSDGTVIPKGCTVAACPYMTHRDEASYENSGEFQAFRFSEIRDLDGEGTKHQLVSTNSEWILFGHGKHACPGRFFAVAELKMLLAHVLLNYDVKLPDGEGLLPPKWFGPSMFPDPQARVVFRKRQ